MIMYDVNDVIRKENNAVLEFRQPLIETVRMWSNFYDYSHDEDIVTIKENVDKNRIKYYFTNSMPTDVGNNICKIFSEQI